MRNKVIVMVVLFVLVFGFVAGLMSHSANACIYCGGSACDCTVPYHGRGGHVWDGCEIIYGTNPLNSYTVCIVTYRSGCEDFC